MNTKILITRCIALSLISLLSFANEPLKPLPSITVDSGKAALGDKLFHDKALSPNKTISCASCHDLKKGGTDQLPVSIGIHGQKGPINAPTVYNSQHHIAQFWDGRAKDLQEQAAGPVTNPKEMGSNWPYVIKTLSESPEYVKLFKKNYQGKINKDTITDAIAIFEKTLDTPSRFDDYLKGDKSAITEQEKKGYDVFKSVGCTTCHNGINVGGGMYMKMGLVQDYFKDRGDKINTADLGRYNVTKQVSDKHVFKVPTLRNIDLTAPYFHDGSTKSLSDAVRKMGKYQLGKNLSDEEITYIVAFLKSLRGKSL